MVTVRDIYRFLSVIAPPALAESWDNCGILCGDENRAVSKALVSLDITCAVAQEAYEKGAQLVISHHPVIFRPLKAVPAGSAVWALANRSLSAICMHTNLDVCSGGVNDVLAGKIGLSHLRVLEKSGERFYKKVVAFVPEAYADAVRSAMTRAGAGLLGNYDSCSFASSGSGYFRPLKGSRPFIGRPGETERAQEMRIEAVCPAGRLEQVVSAMREAHPYEGPAYDIFTDEALAEPYGLGRVGDLAEPAELRDFAFMVKKTLGCSGVQVCDAGKKSSRIAVCSGAEDESAIPAALDAGADTLVTGEIKHSSMIEALERGINVVAAGHFATETVICAKIAEELSAEFSAVSFETAEKNRDPAFIL